MTRAALLAVTLFSVAGATGCELECHEVEVRFDAQLPPVESGTAVLLRNAAPAPQSGTRSEPTRTEGPAELTLTLRASHPLALHACADPVSGVDPIARGGRLVEGDARGTTTVPFAWCFWLEPEGVDTAQVWSVQAGVASEHVFVFGENTSVDPRDGCPGVPSGASYAWTLVPVATETDE